MRNLKIHANIESRLNREIRETTGLFPRSLSRISRISRVSNSSGEDLGDKLPVDALLRVWQHAVRISLMQNQNSFTRGAAMKKRRGNRQFPISKAHIARRIA
jgi:hypothetical protein